MSIWSHRNRFINGKRENWLDPAYEWKCAVGVQLIAANMINMNNFHLRSIHRYSESIYFFLFLYRSIVLSFDRSHFLFYLPANVFVQTSNIVNQPTHCVYSAYRAYTVNHIFGWFGCCMPIFSFNLLCWKTFSSPFNGCQSMAAIAQKKNTHQRTVVVVWKMYKTVKILCLCSIYHCHN